MWNFTIAKNPLLFESSKQSAVRRTGSALNENYAE